MYSLNYSPNYILSIEVKFKNGKDDFGYISYKNGDKYEGYMKEQVATGNGRLTLSSGAYYEGRFDDSGLCDGVLALPQGVYFKDIFDCDCFVEGTFVFSDQTIFTGAWNLENDEWVVVEGQMKDKNGKILGVFEGDNIVVFDNDEHTQVKIVFARCQILGNSSFYEGGFDPNTQTLDGKGLVVGSTRKYSITNMEKGRKQGEWLFVNYWEDLPYTKRVDFKDDQKIKCRTIYGNGLHFEGLDDFGEGTATFPFICSWIKVEGTLSGNNGCPVMKGVLSIIGGEEKGIVEIKDDNGNLKTLFQGKDYYRIEDLIETWKTPKIMNLKKAKNQSPEIKKKIVTSIMMSKYEANEHEIGRRSRNSRNSSISQGRKRSKVIGKSPVKKNNWTEFYDEKDQKKDALKSKIKMNRNLSKLSKSDFKSRRNNEPDPKKFQTNKSNNLFEEEAKLQYSRKNRTVHQISYLGSDEDDREGSLNFSSKFANPEGLVSDNERESPKNEIMDLISETPVSGSPVTSPAEEIMEKTKNKSHFSFHHSFQDLQSFDGVRVELITSYHTNDFSNQTSVRRVLSPRDVSSMKIYGTQMESDASDYKRTMKSKEVNSKIIMKSSTSPNESSGGIFRQNPSEAMKTFFVEKENRILLFKDIQNFYSIGHDNLRLTGKMIAYTKEFEYQGDILNDVMDGEGELTIKDKKVSGKFNNNEISFGKIELPGMIYEGEISDLKKHGKGEIRINKACIKATFVNDLLDENSDVTLTLDKINLGKVEVISTKNEGMYLLSQQTGDKMFIFDICKKIFRQSY
jgi:hypothetical protein